MSDDIFDFFKKHKQHGHYEHNSTHHESPYYHDEHSHHAPEKFENYSRAGHQSHDVVQQILFQILRNPKYLIVLVIVALLAIILLVALLVVLLPSVVSILGGVSKVGLKGLLETIWFGAGK